jgi:hypothetical protein
MTYTYPTNKIHKYEYVILSTYQEIIFFLLELSKVNVMRSFNYEH